MPDYVNNNNISGNSQPLRSTRYQVSRRKKDRERKKREEKKMKNEKKTYMHAQGAGRVLKGQGCCLLVVRSVLWCAQLMDNRRTTIKARRKTRQEKKRAETKKQKETEDRNKVVGFRWGCFCLVFWDDPVWYRMIYRDRWWYRMIYRGRWWHIISHIMRYHKVRCIGIVDPYPEFCGLIWICRIPSKNFSIPNSATRYSVQQQRHSRTSSCDTSGFLSVTAVWGTSSESLKKCTSLETTQVYSGVMVTVHFLLHLPTINTSDFKI